MNTEKTADELVKALRDMATYDCGFEEESDTVTQAAELYKPLICDNCKDIIQPGEYYGECDGRLICSDCIEDEWKGLTAQEKFVALGYDYKFNG